MKYNNTDNNKSRYREAETTENAEDRPTNSRKATGVQRLQRHRGGLRDLADSDLPVAWVADALLDIADDADGDQDGSGEDGSGGDGGR